MYRASTFRHGPRQHLSEARLAGRNPTAHFMRSLEDAVVLPDVAGQRRIGHLLHPALFLREMLLGMPDELVECRQHLVVLRIGKPVQQLDEFLVSLIHYAPIEHQGFVPFHDRHA
jgi:hypothetical protein